MAPMIRHSRPRPPNVRPPAFRDLDAELPGGGWPQGQLIELLHDDPGIGELSLLAPALAAQTRAGRACVWILPCERSCERGLQATTAAAGLALSAGVDRSRHRSVLQHLRQAGCCA